MPAVWAEVIGLCSGLLVLLLTARRFGAWAGVLASLVGYAVTAAALGFSLIRTVGRLNSLEKSHGHVS